MVKNLRAFFTFTGNNKSTYGFLILILLISAFPLTAQQSELSLKQLQEMALQNNPGLAKASAEVRAAEGAKLQAGLLPNPTVGVILEELSERSPEGLNEEHLYFFVEQEIPLGGKLGKAKSVSEQVRIRAEHQKEVQRIRILSGVTAAYYEVLGSQEKIRTQEKLHALLKEAEDITHELMNVGQADRPDLLEAEIQARLAENELVQARGKNKALWMKLSAVLGKEELPVQSLAGNLENPLPNTPSNDLLQRILEQSPEIAAAQARVEESRSRIHAEKSLSIPDLKFRGGIGHNYEKIPSTGEDVGLEGFIEAGITLPIFNRNQGRVAIAQVELEQTEQDLRQTRLKLSEKFAKEYANYTQTRALAETYKQDLLPRAREAHQLYLVKFQQMGAAYPQVLIAQRNLYQLELAYIDSLVNLHLSALGLQNFLLTPEFELDLSADMMRR